MPSDFLLILDNICKHYGHQIILKDLSFNVREGEAIAFLGRNGVGKSTLLAIMAGLVRPDQGRIRSDQLKSKRSIGLVTHEAGVYGALSARENLCFFGDLYNIIAPLKQAEVVLNRVGLGKIDNRPVSNFSRGMLQRLAIARALLPNPALLLLDEPFSGLDPEGVEALLKHLLHLKSEGITIVFSTHRPDLAERLANRVFRLSHATLTAIDSASTNISVPSQQS